MLVCATCKKEMTCVKTGIGIRYREDGSHVYPADLFECTSCGARIANSGSANAYFSPNENTRITLPEDIWMDK